MNLLKIVLFAQLFVLTACGGNKIVTTTDDSADYASAIQLPPLKKDIGQEATASANLEYESNDLTEADTNINQRSISSSIVDVSNNLKRVEINAQMNDAWPYFLNTIRQSGVTIHGRNNNANRIEVGCGDIDDGANDEAKRSGGWSIFNRSAVIYEYCVMQLSESGGATLVSVLNRRGEEVAGSKAITLLNKIVSQ